MTRVAVFDCGTNLSRVLSADLNGHGGLTDVVCTLEVVRLGKGAVASVARARTHPFSNPKAC